MMGIQEHLDYSNPIWWWLSMNELFLKLFNYKMAGIQENIALEIILIQNGGYSQKYCFRNYSNPKWRVALNKLF